MLYGYFVIAETTFAAGSVPATFALNEGAVSIQSVTPPVGVNDGHNYGVPQYVAAVYTEDQAKLEPYGGYSAFIDINDTGNYAMWLNPSYARQLRSGRGVLINSLLVNPAAYVPPAPGSATPPNVTNGTQRWAANLTVSINQLGCSFFDFNWIQTFQAVMANTVPFNDAQPLSIEIVSNPTGGAFKSTIVGGDGQQAMSSGAVIFSTCRIIRLQDVTAGDYVFTYKVTDTKGLSSTCTLTLTVV
jgi:hypothetical protein